MSGRTKIEWADAVWNPATGCTKVSAGCTHCCAERQATRFAGRAGYRAEHPFAVTLHSERLDEPLRWRKPRKIFVCSMGDLFHPDVPDEFIFRVWQTIAATPWHTYMILTKRPERMAARVPVFCGAQWVAPNLWLGVSVEDQATADDRIPQLLRCPAAVRFVSYEPAMGPLDLRDNLVHVCGPNCTDAGYGINWVIAGGESGPKARPAHPDWFRSVRDQCHAAAVPFFFKHWGEWAVPNAMVSEMEFVPKFKTGREHAFDDGPIAQRVGKRAAGRLLDGVEHNACPGGSTP